MDLLNVRLCLRIISMGCREAIQRSRFMMIDAQFFYECFYRCCSWAFVGALSSHQKVPLPIRMFIRCTAQHNTAALPSSA